MDDAGIAEFVQTRYPEALDSGVILFKKGPVNGPSQSPVYDLLKKHVPGDVPHNFYKYLVDKRGVPLRRYLQSFDNCVFPPVLNMSLFSWEKV